MKYTLLIISFSFCCLLGYSQAPENDKSSEQSVHKVEQGQTLYSISRKYQLSMEELKAANPGLSQLKAGSILNIPTKETNTPPQTATDAVSAPARGTDEEHENMMHKVEPGETLFRISKTYGVSVDEIKEANQLGSKGINPGQELIIPKSLKEKATKTLESAHIQTKTKASEASKIKTETKTSLTGYPSIIETGIGKLDSTMKSDLYLVTHKTAKEGTLVTLKNIESGNIAHAKVAGNHSGNELIIINRKVYEKLEAKNAEFGIEVSYTPE